ncbi:hypothetical protein B0T25DRAFT_536848 [Lasiosphaeria hispida]|uniref:Uncharacterized protein n=1 Tax=Lasiosphaeria hispida TaxID=260671 RepID=A0AAJ0HKK5_9PEZI|nr:hypothetical protein B0T25DRAFT_536848 [Lasiosphaeria hispida]
MPFPSVTGYVTGFDEGTDKIFHVTSDATKLFELTICAGAIYGDKRATVVLNNGTKREVFLPVGNTFPTLPPGRSCSMRVLTPLTL